MPSRIFLTANFDRFAKREGLADATLVDAIERVESGLVDARLGGGLMKLRVARAGQGRRDGYRTIVACKVGERAFFLVGYGKNELGNIGDETRKALRILGKKLLEATEQDLAERKAAGIVREIER